MPAIDFETFNPYTMECKLEYGGNFKFLEVVTVEKYKALYLGRHKEYPAEFALVQIQNSPTKGWPLRKGVVSSMSPQTINKLKCLGIENNLWWTKIKEVKRG